MEKLQGDRFGRLSVWFLRTASWVVRTIRRNWRKVGCPTCKRRLACESRQERLRMRVGRSLWVSRCTPELLLQARVIGAEESWVEIQGQTGSGSGSGGASGWRQPGGAQRIQPLMQKFVRF